jgi:2-iminobutanoate/2-iminopropanoate deaminase
MINVMKKYYISSEHTGAPLSGACETNGIIYVSGQIHADEHWKLIGTTIQERFHAVMKRIEGILKEANLTSDDIMRVQLYLTNLDELPALNEVYGQYFNKHPMPVRTAIGVSKLPLGASLEIDVIASR